MAIRHAIYQGKRRRSQLVADAHIPDVHHVHTEEFDDDILELNQKLRNDGAIRQGQANPLMDGGVIEYAFQVPSVWQWNMFKRKHPDVYKQLMSKNDDERRMAARILKGLHPEWEVTESKN